MKPDEIEKIKEKAQVAIFYVDQDDIYYRMNACEEEEFYCQDEDTGEVYTVRYDSVGPTCGFYKLELIKQENNYGLPK